MAPTRLSRGCARTHVIAGSDMRKVLEPTSKAEGWVNSKVVATLGPSSHDVDVLETMLRAGMSVARIDLTWGPLDYHMRTLHNLQEAMERSHKLCAVMVDTLGREVMIRRPFSQDSNGWPVHHDCFTILKDEEVKLVTTKTSRALNGVQDGKGPGAQMRTATVTYEGLPSIVQPDDIVYVGRYLAGGAIEEGSLWLKVVSVKDGEVLCRAQNTAELCGLLTVFLVERRDVGVSDAKCDLPVFTKYDCDCLACLASEFEIDFVCTSYTRSGEDVHAACAFLGSIGMNETQIVAKLETRQALINFESILESASAIIVSRGVLGLDVAPEKMALVQKALVAGCNMVGKPVIITRVLDNMSDKPRPTRAEATDVANIILDGADGVLLGAETLRGNFPSEAIAMAEGICRQAEGVFDHRHHYDFLMESAINAMNAAAPPRTDSPERHGAYMWQLDQMVEEGLHKPPPLPPAPSMPNGREDSLHQVSPSKLQEVLSYMAHPSYSSTDEHLMKQQHTQQKTAHERHEEQHEQQAKTPQYQEEQRQQKELEEPQIETVMARGEAELRGVANLQSQQAQQQQQQQQLQHPDKQTTDQPAANGLHEEQKPVSLHLQGPSQGLVLGEAANGAKDQPQLGGKGTGPASDKGGYGVQEEDGPMGQMTQGEPQQELDLRQQVPSERESPDIWPAGPLPEGPVLPAASEPPSPLFASTPRARHSPVRQRTKGSGTASPDRDKTKRSPSVSADLDSTLQAMITASGGKAPVGRTPSGRQPRALSTSETPSPASGVATEDSEQVESLAGSVRQTDVVPGATSEMPSAKAELEAAYHNLGGTFAMSSLPYMSKLESITSSAVRAAEKSRASLILVFTHTSRAAQLVAKYRPPMPILTLVVPRLMSNGLKWRLEGKSHARQCLLTRGLLPMLSAPGPSGDQVLEEAVITAARWGLVAPHQHVVIVERVHEHFAVKIVAVDELGLGIKKPGGHLLSPRRPGMGGAMSPAPLSRALVVSTPQGTGRPSTSPQDNFLMANLLRGGFNGGVMSPIRTPGRSQASNSGPNSLGWLNRCPHVLHPSSSDASGEKAAAAAAAAQELLSTSQWGRHHTPPKKQPPKELPRGQEAPAAAGGLDGPEVSNGTPKTPTLMPSQKEPFGSYTDLNKRLPAGPELPFAIEEPPILGDRVTSDAVTASSLGNFFDGNAQPVSPGNILLAGAAPGNLLVRDEKLEAGVAEQAEGLGLTFSDDTAAAPLHHGHPSLNDLLKLQAETTQEQDDQEGGMGTRNVSAEIDAHSPERHPGTPIMFDSGELPPAEQVSVQPGMPMHEQQHEQKQGLKREQGKALATQPSAVTATPFNIIPDPSAPGSPEPGTPESEERSSGSAFTDLAQALKKYEASFSPRQKEPAAVPIEPIGTSPVVGMGYQQQMGGTSDEGSPPRDEGAFDVQRSAGQPKWKESDAPSAAQESVPQRQYTDNFYLEPNAELDDQAESRRYFEIPPAYPIGDAEEGKEEEQYFTQDPYADTFDNEKVRAEESRAVRSEQAPPDESQPGLLIENMQLVENLEEDPRVAAPGVGSPGHQRSAPSTPRLRNAI
ncbi:pyruvate kinase [Dunaliella salina]|uniref:pyruvate kinase n=1 Tax=Dunaliella salina TaxID=3046 RepID=A0ABQ7GCM3_DUNSA|nr:pyruvate kinase [Dunaliella salina]|eukprot:KAF5832362.1 pyruvate kinase [Dunaliella salina]